MVTITTRAGKGSALTHAEVDANFTNLNTDKVEKAVTLTANYLLKGNGTNSATITGVIEDASGNLGLGVTPSGWSAYKAFQVGTVGAFWANPSGIDVYLSANYYFGSGADRYIANGAATYYKQNNGAHTWGKAASGTAGNSISFTEVMTLDANGNLGVGEPAPDYKLDVNGSIGFAPGASVTPVDNGDVVFEFTNNTTLTIRAKGSDGTVRSATITLA